MAFQVHRQKGGQLQEARIDAPSSAGIAQRHRGDEVAFEPLDRALVRQFVDHCRRSARIDRAAHQCHGSRGRCVTILRHQRDSGEGRYAGLADGQHMRAGAKFLHEGDDIIDIIVEAELSGRQRNVARIFPVGDVHIMVAQERPHSTAQQGREMARHWRDQQYAGLLRFHVILRKVKQVAEGEIEQHFLSHCNKGIAATDFVYSVRRALMGEARALEHIHEREHAAGHGPIGNRTDFVTQTKGQFSTETSRSQHVLKSLIACV